MNAASLREEIVARLAPLAPQSVELTDESDRHAGHRGANEHATRTGATEGTHFSLKVAARAFAGRSVLERHRMIYRLLGDLMHRRIHALAIEAKEV